MVELEAKMNGPRGVDLKMNTIRQSAGNILEKECLKKKTQIKNYEKLM